MVRGDGSQEDFRPRSKVTQLVSANGVASFAFALDPVTGEQMMSDQNGNINRLNSDGTTTSILAGLAYSGLPQSMAITYVGGERRFLIALSTELIQAHPSGAVDVLYTRTNPTRQRTTKTVTSSTPLTTHCDYGEVARATFTRLTLWGT